MSPGLRFLDLGPLILCPFWGMSFTWPTLSPTLCCMACRCPPLSALTGPERALTRPSPWPSFGTRGVCFTLPGLCSGSGMSSSSHGPLTATRTSRSIVRSLTGGAATTLRLGCRGLPETSPPALTLPASSRPRKLVRMLSALLSLLPPLLPQVPLPGLRCQVALPP